MKFFHLSDLHVGRRLVNRALREDQEHILAQIVRRAEEEQPDAVVIAGDVFDKSDPSAEAVALFSRFVTDLSAVLPDAPIMIVSGNHDSGERIDMYRDILDRENIYLSGSLPSSPDEYLRSVTLEDEWGPVSFYLMPYVRPGAVRRLADPDDDKLTYEDAVKKLIERENVDEDARSVLVSHQYFVPHGKTAEEMDAERASDESRKVGNVDAVSARVLEPFTYAALGHIHKPMDVAPNARYCGTPLQYSLSEADQEKSISVVELAEPGQPASVRQIPLEPQHRIRRIKGKLADVIKDPSSDYVYITLTDEEDLDAAEMSSRLLDAFPFKLGHEHTSPQYERTENPAETAAAVRSADPLTLCLAFLGDVSDEERELLKKIIEEASAE